MTKTFTKLAFYAVIPWSAVIVVVVFRMFVWPVSSMLVYAQGWALALALSCPTLYTFAVLWWASRHPPESATLYELMASDPDFRELIEWLFKLVRREGIFKLKQMVARIQKSEKMLEEKGELDVE